MVIGASSIDVMVLSSRPSTSCVTSVVPGATAATDVSGAVEPAVVVTE
jgi:hypothetical protein